MTNAADTATTIDGVRPRPMRVGVYGTGRWATEVHAPGIAAASGMVLAGIAGRNDEQTAALARAMGVPAFASLDEMLPEVDAISFAVPPYIQSELALAAIRAGRHVILEKPIATDLAAADALVDAAEANSVSSVVFFTRLFLAPVRDLIASAASRHLTSGDSTFRSAVLLPGSRYDASSWRQDRFGALWDTGPHALAVMLHTLGPAIEICASNPSPAAFEAELRHAGGARSAIHINMRDATVERVDDRFSVSGPAGNLAAGPFTYDRVSTFAHAAQSLLAPRSDYASIALGRDVVAIIEAAIDSINADGHATPIAPARWRPL